MSKQHLDKSTMVDAIYALAHVLSGLAENVEYYSIVSDDRTKPCFVCPLFRRMSEVSIVIKCPRLNAACANGILNIDEQLLGVVAEYPNRHRIPLVPLQHASYLR